MQCVLERHGRFETVIDIPRPIKYLQDSCQTMNSYGANFIRVSALFEQMGKCLPQISPQNKCDALLSWTQSIYFRYEHLDYHYHPQGFMSDYRGEMITILERCKKLQSYMKEIDSSKESLLPPECGKEREVAQIVYNYKPGHYDADMYEDYFSTAKVAKTQGEYFKSLEDNFDCPRPHYICGEQLSDDPAEF